MTVLPLREPDRSKPPPAKKPSGSISTFTRKMIASVGRPLDTNPPCGSCHACCSEPELEVDITPDEEAAFPEAVPRSDGVGKQLPRKANGDCVHLEGGRCSIYSRRPSACRAYDCRVYLLGHPFNARMHSLFRQVLEMWDDWRLETVEDVDAMFAWQRALNETLTHLAGSSQRDEVVTVTSLITLFLHYQPRAHAVRDSLGLPLARKLAREQNQIIRELLLRNADSAEAISKAAE